MSFRLSFFKVPNVNSFRIAGYWYCFDSRYFGQKTVIVFEILKVFEFQHLINCASILCLKRKPWKFSKKKQSLKFPFQTIKKPYKAYETFRKWLCFIYLNVSKN